MEPTENTYHVAIAIAIGLVSAWAGDEIIIVLPLGMLLMLTIGALTQVPVPLYPAVQYFIAGAIILFALCVSMLRNKSYLLYVLPVAAWSYFAGGSFMQDVPSITTPLFFMIGIVVSTALILAIGVALGITLTENVRVSVNKIKSSPVFLTFLSFF
jgi:hydrogenase/urease accessory protein HupE